MILNPLEPVAGDYWNTSIADFGREKRQPSGVTIRVKAPDTHDAADGGFDIQLITFVLCNNYASCSITKHQTNAFVITMIFCVVYYTIQSKNMHSSVPFQ